MKRKIVIGGYYGYGSLGDESVLDVLIGQLRIHYPEYEITVLAASPASMKKRYGVRCVHRYDIAAIVKELSGAELYISGGGSLMQDATSLRSLRYYSRLIRLAKTLGAKVYVYSNGIGPLKRSDIAAGALECCDMISVRDKASLDALNAMSVSANISADPFFLAEAAPESEVYSFLCDRGVYTDDYFTVSIRRCKGKKQINEDALLHALMPHIAKGKTPLFVSMQDSCDFALCIAMADMTGGYAVTPTNAGILLGIQKKAEFALGMRLHFLLSAIAAGIPVTALSYDPKIDNVLDYCAGIKAFNAFDFDAEILSDALDMPAGYTFKKDTMQELARRDVEVIGQLLEDEAELVNV